MRNEKIEKQISYFNYLLGTDILKHILNINLEKDLEINYYYFYYISNKYIISEEYLDEKVDYYKSLKSWVQKNNDFIKSSYLFFCSVKLINNNYKINDIVKEYEKILKSISSVLNDDIFNGNLKILNYGVKDNKKFAFIEKSIGDSKEYIIAHDYKINNNLLTWSKAYTYYDNKEKALFDFKELINEDVYNIYDIKQDIGIIS